ncbi:MAG: DUF2905 domain-containing protein [Thermomicrobiales bacterium]|nr:DUF2905 domain-containing protein [Thermomicrobiales bacterium]
MSERDIGLLIIALGVLAILIGLLVMTGAFSWFGRLPGDIRIERGNSRVYIPLASMLLISIALSIVSAVIRRLLG